MDLTQVGTPVQSFLTRPCRAIPALLPQDYPDMFDKIGR